MSRTFLIGMTMLAAVACSGGDKKDVAAADSLSRDLQLAPVDSAASLNDRPAPASRPAAAPRPATPRPVASSRTLSAGTEIQASASQEITSRRNKAGESFTASVAADVKDSRGRVVIPSGSTITFTIVEIAPAENKGQADGKLTIRPTSVMVNGQSYSVNGTVSYVEHHLKGRGVTAGDAAKVGAGAAAGAIAGKVISGKGSKGAIIGGIIGAGAGTAVAIETADRDVVVPAGGSITLVLDSPLTVSR